MRYRDWQRLKRAVCFLALVPPALVYLFICLKEEFTPPGELPITFATIASSSVLPFFENWVHHARRVGLSPLLVAALDQDVVDRASQLGVPAVLLNTIGASYIAPSSHGSAFRKLGTRKTDFIRFALSRKTHLALTDVDVVWLEDPRPYWARPDMARADILVSSDCISAKADAAGRGADVCSTITNFNTGLMLLRATRGTRRFVRAWKAKIEWGLENNITWMRDQPAFNLVAKAAWTPLPDGSAPPYLVDGSRWDPRQRLLLGVGPGAATALGVLPPSLFASGHLYFVQSQRNAAMAVHTTFQFGDGGKFPFGKRMRLRQFGLWALEPPPAPGERFLAMPDVPLTAPPSLPGDPRLAHEQLLRLHFAADALWRQRVVQGLAAARALNRTLILPRPTCYCDRSWEPLSRCRLHSVEDMVLPFVCPLDHITLPATWDLSRVPFRMPGYHPPNGDIVVVRVGGGAGGGPPVHLPGSLTDKQLEVALAPHRQVAVLSFVGESPPLCALQKSYTTPGRWWPESAGTYLELEWLTSMLTDSEPTSFCYEPHGARPRPGTEGLSLLERLCGPKEEAQKWNRTWEAYGSVRAHATCSCEWGYRKPKMLPVITAEACAP